MIYPTIHLNGTGARGLVAQYQDAHSALHDALAAVCQSAPHGRDYYTQTEIGGRPAYETARSEHDARLSKIRAVMAEFERLALRAQKGGRA